MKDRHIGFGLVLLTIGVLLLLINFGMIGWSFFDTLLEFWPAIFIVIGVNIIFRKNEIIKAVSWLVFIGAILTISFYNGGDYYNGSRQWQKGSDVKIEKLVETNSGEMKLDIGGTTMDIGSTDSDLVEANLSSQDIEHSINYSNGKSDASVSFKRNNHFVLQDYQRENCSFNLNDSVLWKLDMDTGAVSGTVDMSNLKVRDFDLNTGAANLKLIFGSRYKTTNVSIDAGASSLDIEVPKDSGVKIKVDGVLNNTNIGSLNWVKQGDYYVSKNYDNAENKIDVDVNMGVGSFNVDIK